MTYVEHVYSGFQWAEPLRKGAELEVEQVGKSLEIAGLFPRYGAKDLPSDLVRQYEIARKHGANGRTGKNSPHIRFANADTDEKLLSFVRTFGPVAAQSVRVVPASKRHYLELRERRLGTAPDRLLLTGRQDMQELRNERSTYWAALDLVIGLNRPDFDYLSAQHRIAEIAANIGDWPRQWEREQSQRKVEPLWRLHTDSLKRIEQLSSFQPDVLLPPNLDARIVICELLNVFRATVFPNLSEMHASITYGIRPLLYSILRREFLNPHDVGVCANSQCRDFFEVEREGQQFCSAECSLRQRQRDYWKKRGKKLREKRLTTKNK